jgi:hypothetical protein
MGWHPGNWNSQMRGGFDINIRQLRTSPSSEEIKGPEEITASILLHERRARRENRMFWNRHRARVVVNLLTKLRNREKLIPQID